MRTFTAALLAACTFAPTAVCQEPDGEELVIRSVLVLDRVGRGGRAPVFTDVIEGVRVRGTWRAAAAGDTVTVGERERTWRRLEADANGGFRDRALRGGYALATVEQPDDGVLLLDAAGHRHVYVNGEPRVGDTYNLGTTRIPVQLRKGSNELLFKAGRGQLRAALVPPPADVFVEERDRTLPDVLLRETGQLWAGVIVTNATTRWQRTLSISARAPGGDVVTTALPALPPVSSRKVAIAVEPPPAAEPGHVDLELDVRDGELVLHTTELRLAVRGPAETHVRTFRSEIDGSVQYYAVTPGQLAPDLPHPPALFLSLHGAGVEGLGQARCYQPKSWGHVVAPTNRRPYGFDWEDWGRLDALEVLADAERRLGTDPRRTYLTGHSMGGHGTWNLGVHFPGRFAAIAPSAGWRDFWSYGGGGRGPRDPDAVEQLLNRAANASRTLLLSDNYRQLGVYVLHGDNDRTVRVEQARFMRSHLAGFHTNFAYYEQPGAGHWWGNQCMDWPPLFDFLARNVRPEPQAVRHVAFATVNPGISAQCDWVTIEAQRRSLEPSTAEVTLDAEQRTVTAATANVARLSLDLSSFAEPRTRERDGQTEDATILPAGEPVTVVVDGGAPVSAPWAADRRVRLARRPDGSWAVAEAAAASAKGPHRAGPFKDAFRHRVVFVAGTAGTDEENAWALAKAKYDAETFWYRGNGSIDVVLDADFKPGAFADRGVILYGNAETNGAWASLLGGSPVDVRRGVVRIGDREIQGDDLACLFVYPRVDSDVACVGVVAGTGMTGMRTTDQLPYFVSGVGYPDWIVLGAEMFETGSKGVRGAGFFGTDWSLEKGEAEYR